MSAANMAENIGILKEYYGKRDVITSLIYAKHPLLAMLRKNPDASGKYATVPVVTRGTQGISTKFPAAQKNATAPGTPEFIVPLKPMYAVANVENMLRMASRNKEGAFLSAAKLQLDGAFKEFARALSTALYRDGSGTIGTVNTITTGVIALKNAADARHFEIGQALEAFAGSTKRAGTGYVIAVDEDNGTITVSDTRGGAAATPTGWVANDELVQEGNRDSMITGLAGWTPYGTGRAAALAAPFYGVNRSSHATKLGGIVHDGVSGSAQNIEEALIDLVGKVETAGGSPDVVFVNPRSWRALDKALLKKQEYTYETEAGVGFAAIRVSGVPIIADANCPVGVAHCLTMDSWELLSMDAAPHILTYLDGAEGMRAPNSDDIEFRIGGYLNVTNNAPGYNGVGLLSV